MREGGDPERPHWKHWIPAFAGMTSAVQARDEFLFACSHGCVAAGDARKSRSLWRLRFWVWGRIVRSTTREHARPRCLSVETEGKEASSGPPSPGPKSQGSLREATDRHSVSDCRALPAATWALNRRTTDVKQTKQPAQPPKAAAANPSSLASPRTAPPAADSAVARTGWASP